MSTAGTARPGGRTARTAGAVFGATIEELATRAYDDISIETIAARAGVHKTTVYRRWHRKSELISHALAATAEARIEVPDTGCIDSDLRALCRSVQTILVSPQGGATTRALLAGASTSPEIRLTMQQFWAARLAAISDIITRASLRGELPEGTEPGPTLQALIAPLYYRLLVTGQPLTEQHADLSAAAALAAAQAGVFVRQDEDTRAQPPTDPVREMIG